MQVKILCIGDVVGKPGRGILAKYLPGYVRDKNIGCVIANAENVAGGSGITPTAYDKLRAYGVNVITMGDHSFRRREGLDVLAQGKGIVRPANFATEAIGKGYTVESLGCGVEVAVINLLGQMYMRTNADCPFHAVDRCLKMIDPAVKIRIVDMHAEATSEKIAMGWYLNGRASVVFGTHTHVTTADERILSEGTAYISDLGMTGAHESVLGRRIDRVLRALTTDMPTYFELADGDLRINGILVEVDSITGKAQKMERVCIDENGAGENGCDADSGLANNKSKNP